METKIFINVLVLFFSWKLAKISCEEIVAVFAPRTVFKTHKYNVFIQTRNINEETELAVQFWRFNRTINLNSNNSYPLLFSTNNTSISRKLNFTLTLYREKFGSIQQCSTQHLEVKVDKPIFYTFIQTDKPIYNPREDVKFRIIVVDKDLKPRILNNIDIEIVDPLNRTIDKFTDLEGKNQGVYVEKFKISKNPLFGKWKIKVIVDKFKSLTTSKSFEVQKYELPLFGINIQTSAKHYLPESKIDITFSAGYAFGGYATGNADLIIQNIENGDVYYFKQFENVDFKVIATINIKKEFNTTIHNRVDLRATLWFTELESGLTYNKSTDFTVHADSKVKITPVHPTKFTPGFPFDFKVFVQNWKNETYNSYDEVEMDYIFNLADGTRKKVTFHPLLNNGTAEQYTMVPEDAIEFDIQCRFLNSRVYRVKVGMYKPDHESKKLDIVYFPKFPRLGDDFDVHVRSEMLLDSIVVAIMTKYGNIDTRIINCEGKIICSFKLGVVEEMVPKFTLEVFNVRHIDVMDYGTVEIVTRNIGENYLKIKLPNKIIKTKSLISMEFNTTKSSRIFLLAVDKRLTFLRNTNDLNRDDIMHKVGHVSTNHAVLLDDMQSWHTCTPEELHRIKNGRRTLLPHNGESNFLDDENEDGDFSDFEEFSFSEEKQKAEEEEVNLDDVRENFPHTWLFETIETNSIITHKTFKVPDSITAWQISAFSVHDEKGLGIMKPRELLVKNNFFIKFSLPYSLRYREILRIDVMVFNKNNAKLNATIKMWNLRKGTEPFEFVEYSDCTPKFNSQNKMSLETEVPSFGNKKVSFYIRSSPTDNDFTNEKFINVIVVAEGTINNQTILRDSVRKSLRITNFGVKLLDIDSIGYSLSGNNFSTVLQTNNSNTYSNSYCVISGDYLNDKITIDSELELSSNDLIEQKIALLKWNINLHQYLKSKNKTGKNIDFKEDLQNLLALHKNPKDDKTYSGLTSFLLDTFLSATSEKLIIELPEILATELDILKTYQQESGEFSDFGNFPEYDKNNSDYNNTKKYFETAYVLIPFLKYDMLIDKRYNDVIAKAFDFLENRTASYENNNEALSIVAYIFSLRSLAVSGYDIPTKGYLDNIERTLIDHGGKEVCIKLRSTDEECNLRHTAYTAMTFINLNLTQKAVPLVYWLLKSYNNILLNGDYYNAALLSEPISKVANLLSSDSIDITVSLKDEFNFEKIIKLTEENSTELHFVNYPTHSKVLISTVSGHGYVSITKVVERTLDFAIAIEPTFHITAKILNNVTKTMSAEIVINVCADYDIEQYSMHEMKHVVYEVQMPSGYIFSEIIGLESRKKDIRLVNEGRKKSYVIIHFMNFQGSRKYCIDIKAIKMFEIKNPLKSSVKVFSFDEKKKFGLEFYEVPQNDTC